MDEQVWQYKVFLLRLWRDGDATIRATIQNPNSGERKAFANSAELLTFLTTQLSADNIPPANTMDENSHLN